MSKRARASTTHGVRHSKRPIDKKLVSISLTNIIGAQQKTNLYAAATFPGTITGLRWDFNVTRSGGTTNTTGNYGWAIVVTPAGTTTSTLAIGNTSSLYDPEQMVLAFGGGCTFNGAAGASNNNTMYAGSTKAMRKLKTGDTLDFIVFGTATERHDLSGAVQFFYKT